MVPSHALELCVQLYIWAFDEVRDGKNRIQQATKMLPTLAALGVQVVWICGVWHSDPREAGFAVIDYRVDPRCGRNRDLREFIRVAHKLGMKVMGDLVPNHGAPQHFLVKEALRGRNSYYKNALRLFSAEEARRYTEMGAPNYFGNAPFVEVRRGVYARTRFTFFQLDFNWEDDSVIAFHAGLIDGLKYGWGFDILRVDCAGIMCEDLGLSTPGDPLATLRPQLSYAVLRDAAGDMPLLMEVFRHSDMAYLHGDPLSLAADCSSVFGEDYNPEAWLADSQFVPVLGGHDAPPLENQGHTLEELAPGLVNSRMVIIDMASLVGLREDPRVTERDLAIDATAGKGPQRYLGRRPPYLAFAMLQSLVAAYGDSWLPAPLRSN